MWCPWLLKLFHCHSDKTKLYAALARGKRENSSPTSAIKRFVLKPTGSAAEQFQREEEKKSLWFLFLVNKRGVPEHEVRVCATTRPLLPVWTKYDSSILWFGWPFLAFRMILFQTRPPATNNPHCIVMESIKRKKYMTNPTCWKTL